MIITQENVDKGQVVLTEIFQKARTSPEFKERLLSQPEATISEVVGSKFQMPKGKGIVVEDQTDDSIIYLNIPAEPNLDDLQLNDDQLQLIAGGITPTFVLAGVVIVTVAAGYGIAAGIDYLVNGGDSE